VKRVTIPLLVQTPEARAVVDICRAPKASGPTDRPPGVFVSLRRPVPRGPQRNRCGTSNLGLRTGDRSSSL